MAEMPLSKREQQIMDVVYGRGEATATQVWQNLPDPPSRTAVRTILGILENKGHLWHEKKGREFVYRPTRQPRQVGQSALRRVLRTFFSGSLEEALAAHFADAKSRPTDEELKRLSDLIIKARKKGR